jgi:hypothetical protein
MPEVMTLLSNETLINPTEDLIIFSTTEMRGRQLRPLITNMSYLLGIFLLSTFTYHISCLLNVLFTQGSFLFSALK